MIMKVISIDEKIVFDDGSTVEDFHEQDCCEHVYADFSQLADTNIMEREFDDIQIEGVESSGFRINGYFVPCYDEQNGYYSGMLSLIIKQVGKPEKKIDISNFVEEHIY